MAQFLLDTFTGAENLTLVSHAPELGQEWVLHSFGSAAEIASNRLRSSTASQAVYLSQLSPATANYYVEANIYVMSTGGGVAGVLARADDLSGGNFYYFALIATGGWELYKFTAGSFAGSPIATGAHTHSAGNTVVLRLQVIGKQLKGFIDGSLVVTAEDTSFTLPGRPGFYVRDPSASDAADLHIDSITAYDIFDFADDANRANQNPAAGWTTASARTGLKVDTNSFYGITGSFAENGAYWPILQAMDAYSEVTVLAAGANESGPTIRGQSDGRFYCWIVKGVDVGIWAMTVGGGWVKLSTTTPGTLVDGDVCRLRAIGSSPTTLRAYKNGVQVGSDVTDSTAGLQAAGYPGIYVTGNASTEAIDGWACKNLPDSPYLGSGNLVRADSSENITIPVGTSIILVAVGQAAQPSNATATINGVSMSIRNSLNFYYANWSIRLFYMLAPPSGSQALVVSGAGPFQWASWIAFGGGYNNITGTDVTDFSDEDTVNAVNAVTSAVGRAVITAFSAASGTGTGQGIQGVNDTIIREMGFLFGQSFGWAENYGQSSVTVELNDIGSADPYYSFGAITVQLEIAVPVTTTRPGIFDDDVYAQGMLDPETVPTGMYNFEMGEGVSSNTPLQGGISRVHIRSKGAVLTQKLALRGTARLGMIRSRGAVLTQKVAVLGTSRLSPIRTRATLGTKVAVKGTARIWERSLGAFLVTKPQIKGTARIYERSLGAILTQKVALRGTSRLPVIRAYAFLITKPQMKGTARIWERSRGAVLTLKQAVRGTARLYERSLGAILTQKVALRGTARLWERSLGAVLTQKVALKGTSRLAVIRTRASLGTKVALRGTARIYERSLGAMLKEKLLAAPARVLIRTYGRLGTKVALRGTSRLATIRTYATLGYKTAVKGTARLAPIRTYATLSIKSAFMGTARLPIVRSKGAVLTQKVALRGTARLGMIRTYAVLGQKVAVKGTARLPLIRAYGNLSLKSAFKGTARLPIVRSKGAVLTQKVALRGTARLGVIRTFAVLTSKVALKGTARLPFIRTRAQLNIKSVYGGTSRLPIIRSKGAVITQKLALRGTARLGIIRTFASLITHVPLRGTSRLGIIRATARLQTRLALSGGTARLPVIRTMGRLGTRLALGGTARQGLIRTFGYIAALVPPSTLQLQGVSRLGIIRTRGYMSFFGGQITALGCDRVTLRPLMEMTDITIAEMMTARDYFLLPLLDGTLSVSPEET